MSRVELGLTHQQAEAELELGSSLIESTWAHSRSPGRFMGLATGVSRLAQMG